MTKPEAASMKAQPPLWISPVSSLPEAVSSDEVAVAPQMTKARVRTAVTPKTTRSVVGARVLTGSGGRSAVTDSSSRPAGWSSWDTNGTFHRVRKTLSVGSTTPAHDL
ncbi:hypothetical protein SMICM17S_12820 [Streptomyces microflavus]